MPARGEDGLAVRAEDRADDNAIVAQGLSPRLTGSRIPQLDETPADRQGGVAIRAEGHGLNKERIKGAFDARHVGGAKRVAGRRIPEADMSVLILGKRRLAIGAENRGPDRSLVRQRPGQRPAGAGIPQVGTRAAGGDNGPTVVAERRRRDGARVLKMQLFQLVSTDFP